MSTLPSAAISSQPTAFYLPTSAQGKNILSPEESFHCINVNRKRQGDMIEVLDGRGGVHQAKIVKASPHSCQIEIVRSRLQPARDYRIELAVSPTKNLDRMEWLVEKTVEIGIDRISLVSCMYSERRSIKTDRLKKKAIGALKQSRNPFLPDIGELVTFTSFISSVGSGWAKFIAHPSPKGLRLFRAANRGHDYLVLIGPEGGFSPDEIDQAQLAGFKPVVLGDSILRTETAGIAACHTLHLINI